MTYIENYKIIYITIFANSVDVANTWMIHISLLINFVKMIFVNLQSYAVSTFKFFCAIFCYINPNIVC